MDIKQKIDKALENFEKKPQPPQPEFLLNEEELNFVKEAEEKKAEKSTEPELPKQKGSLEDKVIAFLSEHPNPSDKELHAWAEEQKLDVHQVETAIYKLATSMVKFLTGGMSVQKGVSPKGVDASELKMGVKVEKEHTTDDDTAERIATDHLSEIPDYYTRLKKMEDDAKIKEEPKKKEEVSEAIKIDNLKKFDKSRTQTAAKRTIDTLIELEDNGVFDEKDSSYVRSVIAIMQRVLHKLKHSVIQ